MAAAAALQKVSLFRVCSRWGAQSGKGQLNTLRVDCDEINWFLICRSKAAAAHTPRRCISCPVVAAPSVVLGHPRPAADAMRSILAVLTALLAPGTVAISWNHKGYTGLFNDMGKMVPRWEFKHYDEGELFSQLDRPIIMRWSEYAETHGRQPKWLYHCTTKTAAKKIAKSGAIYQSDDSNGDARLGEGVYMTAMPVDWADPDMVKANNWGQKDARKFENWNKVNAYIRVRFDKLWDADWTKIEYKGDWQSNFFLRSNVPPRPTSDQGIRRRNLVSQ